MNARAVVTAEMKRREEIREAVRETVGPGGPDDCFTLSQLRRHIAKFYGDEVAYTATPADLWGAVAALTPAWVTHFGGEKAVLKNPSRKGMRKILDKWNETLPPPELPMIRRPSSRLADDVKDTRSDPDSYGVPSGEVYPVQGRWRQIPEPETIGVWTDGGSAKRGGPTHRTRRRYPSYVSFLREFLEKAEGVSSVDRAILEFIVEGRTIRWIADELGMKRPTVHKRVKRLRDEAGIPGPGSGR